MGLKYRTKKVWSTQYLPVIRMPGCCNDGVVSWENWLHGRRPWSDKTNDSLKSFNRFAVFWNTNFVGYFKGKTPQLVADQHIIVIPASWNLDSAPVNTTLTRFSRETKSLSPGLIRITIHFNVWEIDSSCAILSPKWLSLGQVVLNEKKNWEKSRYLSQRENIY